MLSDFITLRTTYIASMCNFHKTFPLVDVVVVKYRHGSNNRHFM